MNPKFRAYVAAGDRRAIKKASLKGCRKIITTGSVAGDRAWIYVGTSSVGLIKIGMSSDLPKRASDLGIEIVYSIPVRSEAAKDIETAAIQALGRLLWDGEWCSSPINDAIDAVNKAVSTARRCAWVDPNLTEDEARQLRIRLCSGELSLSSTATPDRERRISITSFRKAAGTYGAYGGRF